MQKWLSLSLITLTSLGAEEVDPEQLSAIYTEAIWFVVVFGTMAIISYIYSSRHAKQYTQKQAPDVAQKKVLAAEVAKQKEERLDELSKLVDDGLLKEEEFLILRKNIQK
jgi:hypothetical protein